MIKIRRFTQKPLGQVLLATLLFCFIFLALFVGLFKAGSAYVIKERARRATNLTALTGGAVYANGLQLVRESNILLSVAVILDLGKAAAAAIAASVGGPEAALFAAYEADRIKLRAPVQEFQDRFFGVTGPGVYPLVLVEGQALATAQENNLSFLPLYAYNYETASIQNVGLPNMALRFRTAADLIPDTHEALYSLAHEGVRYYFSAEDVESAHNPRHPNQMRVKKDSTSYPQFASWWVRKEKEGAGSGIAGKILARLKEKGVLDKIKKFLDRFKFDVTDRDDPPCHTFSLLGDMHGKIGRDEKSFFQLGEVRVEAEGLSALDATKPIHVYLQAVEIGEFPILREAFQKLGNIPVLDRIMRSSDLLNGV